MTPRNTIPLEKHPAVKTFSDFFSGGHVKLGKTHPLGENIPSWRISALCGEHISFWKIHASCKDPDPVEMYFKTKHPCKVDTYT